MASEPTRRGLPPMNYIGAFESVYNDDVSRLLDMADCGLSLDFAFSIDTLRTCACAAYFEGGPFLNNYQDSILPDWLQHGRCHCLEGVDDAADSAKEVSSLTLVHVAASRGAVECLRLLCKSHPELVNAPTTLLGNTALHNAAAANQVQSAELLIQNGANLCQRSHQGVDPLGAAVYACHRPVAECLLQHGYHFDSSSRSPAALAIECGHADLLGLLLDHGFDPNEDWGRCNLLQLATYTSIPELVRILLNHGADPALTRSFDNPPLFIAVEQEDDVIVRLVLEEGHALVSQQNDTGFEAIHVAAWNGSWPMIELLWQHGAVMSSRSKDGNTPLSLACFNNHADCAMKILKHYKPAEVANRDRDNDTALHYTSWHGNLALMEALIQAGAEVDAKNTSGCTPLWYAAYQDYEQAVVLLLRHGAVLDEATRGTDQSEGGSSPVYLFTDSYTPAEVALWRNSISPLVAILRQTGFRIRWNVLSSLQREDELAFHEHAADDDDPPATELEQAARQSLFGQALDLQRVCRARIRAVLNCDLKRKIDLLRLDGEPLPPIIRNFLHCCSL